MTNQNPRIQIPMLARVIMEGPDGSQNERAMRISDIKWDDQHPKSTLTPEQRRRAQATWIRVGRHMGHPPDSPVGTELKWIEAFSFERNPDREIGTYETIGLAYDMAVRERQLRPTKIQRGQVLHALTLISMQVVDVAHHVNMTDESIAYLKDCFIRAMRSSRAV